MEEIFDMVFKQLKDIWKQMADNTNILKDQQQQINDLTQEIIKIKTTNNSSIRRE